MTGQSIDYKLHCQLQFGEYTQVHESHDNSMLSRTTGAIALRPTGNTQGGYFFMLTTDKRLSRYAWTPLPMPGEVLKQIDRLARRNPAGGEIQFGSRDGTAIEDTIEDEDDLHDEDYVPDNEDSDSNDSYDPEPHPVGGVGDYNDQELPNDDSNDEDSVPADYDSNGEDSVPADDNDSEHQYGADDTGNTGIASNDSVGQDNADDTASVADDTGDVPNTDDDSTEDSGVDNTPEGVAPRSSSANSTPAGVDPRLDQRLAPGVPPGVPQEWPQEGPQEWPAIKVPKSAAHHALCSLIEHELNGMTGLSVLEHTTLAQFNMKRGLAMFGQAATDAVSKEMKQLHDRKTIRPRHSNDLTLEDKRKALGYLMFIKEKRCGTIKARGCADGRKQRLYKTKEETSSPTVRTESLMLSCVIDAKERRNVLTCDVPGAFVQVDVDETVHVRLEGPLAELLAKVDSAL
jgi:hypothetical protein